MFFGTFRILFCTDADFDIRFGSDFFLNKGDGIGFVVFDADDAFLGTGAIMKYFSLGSFHQPFEHDAMVTRNERLAFDAV